MNRSIDEWQKESYRVSAERGFHDDDKAEKFIWIQLGNLHGEVSEAWEEARMPDFDPKATRYREDGKPEGFPSELADIFIRLVDTAETYGIDLEAAVVEKHEYNKTRSYRHGNKRD